MTASRSNTGWAETVRVAIVQTTTDAAVAWASSLSMSAAEEEGAWHEMTRAFQLLGDDQHSPDIILCPELALPEGYYGDMLDLARGLGCIVITGVDYCVNRTKKLVSNQGLIIVPKGWPDKRTRARPNVFSFGKTYPAPQEVTAIDELTCGEFTFQSDPIVWLLHASQYGRIGLCICYDLMDLERALMYRARVHHFLVIAYNRDLQSFQCLAEAFSRSVYANVVICNTGYYGGSVAVSPYYRPYKRTIYRHEGARLFTVQSIELPVKGLDEAQRAATQSDGLSHQEARLFKNRPPGFPCGEELQLRSLTLPGEEG